MGWIHVRDTELHILNMRTRMPFKYGIATLTALPHLFVRVELDSEAGRSSGLASDGLPPKWFTKDPDTAFADELADMFAVIKSACNHARKVGRAPDAFEWWRQLHSLQSSWAQDHPFPPLLWGLGISLVERAVIDAICRANDLTFAAAVRNGALGINLGAIHQDLSASAPADLLPAKPLRKVIARHTVGLSDPLTDSEIPEDERLDDGLPHSLEACIQAYGLSHLKIKACGNIQKDIARLTDIAAITANNPGIAFTLDGNEQFTDVDVLKDWWRDLNGNPQLQSFLDHLLFLEQPLHRKVALDEQSGQTLTQWADRPPMIIDESDGEIQSLPTALSRGYVGTSFKSCKGIMKGIANACLIEHFRRANPQQPYEFSGEDLANVGPVALLEDLAAAATLGITHLERNGHHYFRGLSMYPDDVQQQVLSRHGDLYHCHAQGFATLQIKNGALNIGSVVDAPFGLNIELDDRRYTPLNEWRVESLD